MSWARDQEFKSGFQFGFSAPLIATPRAQKDDSYRAQVRKFVLRVYELVLAQRLSHKSAPKKLAAPVIIPDLPVPTKENLYGYLLGDSLIERDNYYVVETDPSKLQTVLGPLGTVILVEDLPEKTVIDLIGKDVKVHPLEEVLRFADVVPQEARFLSPGDVVLFVAWEHWSLGEYLGPLFDPHLISKVFDEVENLAEEMGVDLA